MNLVMKFGGTSVADADAIRRLAGIVHRQVGSDPAGVPPVVVVSAMGGVTDALFGAIRDAEAGATAQARRTVETIAARHRSAADALLSGERRASLGAVSEPEFERLLQLLDRLAQQREGSAASIDAVAAIGELVSSRLVAAALVEAGMRAEWIDARHVIVTDANHGGASPDLEATTAQTDAHVAPVRRQGRIAVMGGYVGATASGVTTTLGRGGSDYSAAIIGAALGADEIHIWTDVDGLLTADPRVVADPMVVPRVTFAEASELAYFGAKVLHPSTMLPAMARNIPVRILNSRHPERTGTLITADSHAETHAPAAIACKRGVTVVDITSTRMLMAYGFLRRLFEVFERFRTPVDVVATSEVSVSVTVDDTRSLGDIVEALRRFAEVSIEPDMAILCAVGEALRGDPSIFARAVMVLKDTPLRLVSQAAGRRNVTFVLRDRDVPEAMGRLHEAFFIASATEAS